MNRQSRTRRVVPGATIAAPAAIVGSIALTFAPTAAHAVPTPRADLAARATVAGPSHAALDARVAAMRAAAAAPATYVVRNGDTVSAIAAQHGLRTADVLAWNGLTWASLIRPGQVLRLSGGAPVAAAPAAPASVAPAPAPAVGTYVVRAGDTVTAIARAHGATVAAVLSANGLTAGSLIYPGQRLRIPGSTGAAAPATPAATAPAMVPAAAVRTAYVVRAGDTLTAIARRYGVDVGALLSANRLGRSSIIYPGQQLSIPSGITALPGLTAEQTSNARLIVSVGRSLGVPARGIAIALGTAMAESGLRNVAFGDRDSLGLFQQRPSTGWGTAAQVSDATYATRAFFLGSPQTRGLLNVPGWQSMSFAGAAQAVQISAFPNAYAQWEQPATAWLSALS
jgi:LysM repeat protein